MVSAAADVSRALIIELGNSSASAIERQPEPVPISAIESFAWAWSGNRVIAVSIISSVSGRGINTPGFTANFKSQNSFFSVINETGSL